MHRHANLRKSWRGKEATSEMKKTNKTRQSAFLGLKLMSLFVLFLSVFLSGFVPLFLYDTQEVQAGTSGAITFEIRDGYKSPDSTHNNTYWLDNVVVQPGNYCSLVLVFPSTLDLHAPVVDIGLVNPVDFGWDSVIDHKYASLITEPESQYTRKQDRIVLSWKFPTADASLVQSVVSKLYFTKRPGVSVASGDITLTLSSERIYGLMQVNPLNKKEEIHYYQRIEKNAPITWFQAYNEAKTKSYQGMKGYLTTITSSNEQEFIWRANGIGALYEDIPPSKGWLGGTRAVFPNGNRMIDLPKLSVPNPNSADVGGAYTIASNKKAENWYWADGPEAVKAGTNGATNIFWAATKWGDNDYVANPPAGYLPDADGSGSSKAIATPNEVFDFFKRENLGQGIDPEINAYIGANFSYQTGIASLETPNQPDNYNNNEAFLAMAASYPLWLDEAQNAHYAQNAQVAPITSYYVEFSPYQSEDDNGKRTTYNDKTQTPEGEGHTVKLLPGMSAFEGVSQAADTTRIILRKLLDYSGRIENEGAERIVNQDQTIEYGFGGQLDGAVFQAYHVESRFYQLRKSTYQQIADKGIVGLAPQITQGNDALNLADNFSVENATIQIQYEYKKGKLVLTPNQSLIADAITGATGKLGVPIPFQATGSTIGGITETGTTFADLDNQILIDGKMKNAVYLIVEKDAGTNNGKNNVFQYEEPLVIALPAVNAQNPSGMPIVYLYPKNFTDEMTKDIFSIYGEDSSIAHSFGEEVDFKITVPIPDNLYEKQAAIGVLGNAKYQYLQVIDIPRVNLDSTSLRFADNPVISVRIDKDGDKEITGDEFLSDITGLFGPAQKNSSINDLSNPLPDTEPARQDAIDSYLAQFVNPLSIVLNDVENKLYITIKPDAYGDYPYKNTSIPPANPPTNPPTSTLKLLNGKNIVIIVRAYIPWSKTPSQFYVNDASYTAQPYGNTSAFHTEASTSTISPIRVGQVVIKKVDADQVTDDDIKDLYFGKNSFSALTEVEKENALNELPTLPGLDNAEFIVKKLIQLPTGYAAAQPASQSSGLFSSGEGKVYADPAGTQTYTTGNNGQVQGFSSYGGGANTGAKGKTFDGENPTNATKKADAYRAGYADYYDNGVTTVTYDGNTVTSKGAIATPTGKVTADNIAAVLQALNVTVNGIPYQNYHNSPIIVDGKTYVGYLTSYEGSVTNDGAVNQQVGKNSFILGVANLPTFPFDTYSFSGNTYYLFGPNLASSGAIVADKDAKPAALDTTKPTVLSVAPSGVDVDIAKGNLIITFSEPMTKDTAGQNGTSVKLGSTTLTGGTWSGNTLTIPYTTALSFSTKYTVTISGFRDLATDASGKAAPNVMIADSSYSFTTAAKPTVTNATPNGATNKLTGNIVITFNKAMDPNTAGTVNLNGSSVRKLTPGGTVNGTWSDGNTVYTIPYPNGASALTSGSSYTIEVSGFKDAAGNAIDKNTDYKFTPTTDTRKPTVTSATPSGTNISILAGDLVITFDKEMNTTAGTITLNNLPAINAISGVWSNTNKTLTIPYGTLDYDTAYVIKISGFKDTAAPNANTMVDDMTHSFTTEKKPDNDPPTVVHVSPTGTGVTVGGYVSVTFSEAIDISQLGTVSLGSTTLPMTQGMWSNGNTTVMLPYDNLDKATNYPVNVAGFRDIAGNIMVDNGDYSFLTEEEPVYGWMYLSFYWVGQDKNSELWTQFVEKGALDDDGLPLKQDGVPITNTLHPIWLPSQEDAQIFTTNSNNKEYAGIIQGMSYILGLPGGSDYKLVEVNAPKGYRKDDRQAALTMQFEVTGLTDPIIVKNYAKGILPITGGQGILLYLALGMAGMIIVGTLLLKKRRETDDDFELDLADNESTDIQAFEQVQVVKEVPKRKERRKKEKVKREKFKPPREEVVEDDEDEDYDEFDLD